MYRLGTLIFCVIMLSQVLNAQQSYLHSASELIRAISRDEPIDQYIEHLSKSTVEELVEELNTDDKIYAFWINIYNAFIQIELRRDPTLYEKRGRFFKRAVIPIAGKKMSFSDIEHGIIRRSQWLIGLGFIRNPFPSSYKKKLRPQRKEYRIHFALNCGAKSCPPVAIYDYARLDEQLRLATERYLPQYTSYDQERNEVLTTPLFSWFRGDFGKKKGVKNILHSLDLIPNTDVGLKFDDYDWSLHLDNFIEL